MTNRELYNYTLNKVNSRFNEPKLVKGEVLEFKGAFILHFLFQKFNLNFCSDRGLIEISLFKNEKSIPLVSKYPKIKNLVAKFENIDFIVDFIYEHKDEIFTEK